MAVTLGSITARVLVQVADGDPVEVGTIAVDLPLTVGRTTDEISARVVAVIQGADPDHEHVWSWGRTCMTCNARDERADEQVDHGGWEDH